jgi:hypothetical protein
MTGVVDGGWWVVVGGGVWLAKKGKQQQQKQKQKQKQQAHARPGGYWVLLLLGLRVPTHAAATGQEVHETPQTTSGRINCGESVEGMVVVVVGGEGTKVADRWLACPFVRSSTALCPVLAVCRARRLCVVWPFWYAAGLLDVSLMYPVTMASLTRRQDGDQTGSKMVCANRGPETVAFQT